jgi:anti-anti-sigma factor
MAVFECKLKDLSSIKCISMTGRIDALSFSHIQKVFDELILAGERTLLVDMAGVSYVSSAGLRVFIVAQKELTKVGGEIVLSGINEQVFEIFRMSGFTQVFRILKEPGEIAELLRARGTEAGIITKNIDGISIEYAETEAGEGSLHSLGSQAKAEYALYSEEDVAAVRPSEMQFGCGLAALGSSYEEYGNLFGEAMVVKDNFFFYPAVKQPSVDFLLDANKDPGITYKVLNGFGFSGDYRYILSFRAASGDAVDLSSLVRSFFDLSPRNILGVTLIAESKGHWGMHIKQPPVRGAQPANGKSIFDSENFPHWIDFPVEPSYVNHVVVATGIAVRDRGSLPPEIQALISEGGAFHLHGGIFDKAPIGNRIDDFDIEIRRIFNELSVHRIQHLLGKSRFSGGMAALIEIGE